MAIHGFHEFIERGREARAMNIFDKDSAIKSAENLICANRTKHINVRYNFARESSESHCQGTCRIGEPGC